MPSRFSPSYRSILRSLSRMSILLAVAVALSGARPLDAPNPEALPLTPAAAGTSLDTTFFGGTAWDGTDMRWEALESGTWTFDSGVGGPIEGWTTLDRSGPAVDPKTRRLSSSDPRWTGTPCVGAAAGLGGNYSLWTGIFADEADSVCWDSGQGYGNNWTICTSRTYDHTKNGNTSVTFEFDYANDTEPDFDFTRVTVEKNSVETELFAFTGVSSGHASVVLTETELPSPPGPATFTFCFTSDGGWSDEDGLNPTDCGAFAVDDISLSGDITAFADFESDDGGWTVEPLPPDPGGDWGRLEHLADLPAIGVSPCGLADSVMVFFDPSIGPEGGHNDFQNNVALSPWIDLAAAGVADRWGKTLFVDAYAEGTLLSAIFPQFVVQWYPDTCAATGQIGGSEIMVPTILDLGSTPNCFSLAVDLTEDIPLGVERIRIGVGVIRLCIYGCDIDENPTPWFDNVRLAVHDLLTIQGLVDAAAPGDTVRVPPGTYTGIGNHNISFGGKNLVLLGEAGPDSTIIHLVSDPGFLFQSGEDTSSVVSGFTVRGGSAGSGDGGGVFVGNGSGVTIENCRIENCRGTLGSGIFVESGSSLILKGSTVRENFGNSVTSAVYTAGDCRIEDSFILDNHTGGVTGLEYLKMFNTTVAGNDGVGIRSEYYGLIDGCDINGNSGSGGEGFFFTEFLNCDISENSAYLKGGGLALYASTAEGCRISGNTAGQSGGGVYTEFRRLDGVAYPSQVINCLVDGNAAPTGAGITVTRSTPGSTVMTLERNSVVGNHATGNLGGGVYAELGMEVAVIRSIIWGNCADTDGDDIYLADAASMVLTCSAYDPAGAAGPGSLTFNGAQVTTDPLFCNAALCAGAPNTVGDYALNTGSPCLAVSSPCGLLIGARGESSCSPLGVPGDGLPTTPILAAFPNPFRGDVALYFRGSRTAATRIAIYDIQGRVVRTARVAPGVQTWTWDGADGSGRAASPGVYFLRLSSGPEGATASRRVVKVN